MVFPAPGEDQDGRVAWHRSAPSRTQNEPGRPDRGWPGFRWHGSGRVARIDYGRLIRASTPARSLPTTRVRLLVCELATATEREGDKHVVFEHARWLHWESRSEPSHDAAFATRFSENLASYGEAASSPRRSWASVPSCTAPRSISWSAVNGCP